MKLSARWTELAPHPVQDAYKASQKRFIITDAGRRSGKSEIAKRKGVKRAANFRLPNGRFLFTAPTHDQAAEIYWDDVKALCAGLIVRKNETHRWVQLVNGAKIYVAGMDVPERAEGSPLDGIICDEFANFKPHAWPKHIRPALSTKGRLGWAIFPSVPEGRNHYFKLWEEANRQIAELGDASDWAIFHWKSAEIIDPEEIAAARRDLDELTFRQEYEGAFVNYAGLAYDNFDRNVNAKERLRHDPGRPLLFFFDFNASPGIAVVAQELPFHEFEPLYRPKIDRHPLQIIGEVYIPRHSKTSAVCRKLIEDWGPAGKNHRGEVHLYGDATGGSDGSAKDAGSDWDIIKRELRPVFGERIRDHVPHQNPRERARVNALRSRVRTTEGIVRLLVDPYAAPHVVEDFEGTTTLEGGSGEIDKDANEGKFSHMTDGIGYYCAKQYPVAGPGVTRHTLRR